LWTDTQFYEMVNNFTHFMNTLKLRLKQGLEGQIKAQKHGGCINNPIKQIRFGLHFY
jgi:hypothetical protein